MVSTSGPPSRGSGPSLLSVQERYALAAVAGTLVAKAQAQYPFVVVAAIAVLSVALYQTDLRTALKLGLVFALLEATGLWVLWLVGGPQLFFANVALHAVFRVGAVISFAICINHGGELLSSIAVPSLWLAFEWVRTFSRLHPWLIGDSFAAHPLVIQIADLGGAYAIAFVFVALGHGLALAFIHRKARFSAFGLLCLGLTLLYGWVRTRGAEPSSERGLRVGIVQYSVPSWLYELGEVDAEIERFIETTYLESLGTDVDLLIWPESAIQADPRSRSSLVTALARSARAPLVAGLLRTNAEGSRFNTVWYFPRAGQGEIQWYDKRGLIPFFEGRLEPGKEARVLAGEQLNIFPMICWESLFPHFARRAAEADLLLVVTDDGTLGYGDLAYQHAKRTVLRAVEQRRTTIHAAQTGPSWVIDHLGIIRSGMAHWESGVLYASIDPKRRPSIFAQTGELAPVSMSLLGLALLIVAGWRARKRGQS
jgi:apolipoprotein N-acyltransferase